MAYDINEIIVNKKSFKRATNSWAVVIHALDDVKNVKIIRNVKV